MKNFLSTRGIKKRVYEENITELARISIAQKYFGKSFQYHTLQVFLTICTKTAFEDGTEMSLLGEDCDLSQASISRQVNAFRDLGLVVTIEAPFCRRNKLVFLTSKGEIFLKEYHFVFDDEDAPSHDDFL